MGPNRSVDFPRQPYKELKTGAFPRKSPLQRHYDVIFKTLFGYDTSGSGFLHALFIPFSIIYRYSR